MKRILALMAAIFVLAFMFLIAFFLPLTLQGQTQIDPTTQIKWPLLTGSGAPSSGICSNINYGQRYVDITLNPIVTYTCGPFGWQVSSGGGVTQITAGTNVTISPSGGTGNVTINAGGGGGGTVSPATGGQLSAYSGTGVSTTIGGVSGSTVDPVNGLISLVPIASAGTTLSIVAAPGEDALDIRSDGNENNATVFISVNGSAIPDINSQGFYFSQVDVDNSGSSFTQTSFIATTNTAGSDLAGDVITSALFDLSNGWTGTGPSKAVTIGIEPGGSDLGHPAQNYIGIDIADQNWVSEPATNTNAALLIEDQTPGANVYAIKTRVGPVSFGDNLTYGKIQIPATIYSAAGTALPSCASGINGATAIVSDATLPTYLAAYTSGGAVVAPVMCNGTIWVTY